MKFIYYVEGFLAFSDPDTYDKGCDPTRSKSYFDPEFRCEAATLEGLISELCQEFHAGRDCILLDSCDEEGRLDLQVYQSSPFSVHRVSNQLDLQWRKGERDLWLTNYLFEVKFRIENMPLNTYPDFLNKLPHQDRPHRHSGRGRRHLHPYQVQGREAVHLGGRGAET